MGAGPGAAKDFSLLLLSFKSLQFLNNLHPSSLIKSPLHTDKMAKGDVVQAEKSFMGMPVSNPRHLRALDTWPHPHLPPVQQHQFYLNGTARRLPGTAKILRDGIVTLGDGYRGCGSGAERHTNA